MSVLAELKRRNVFRAAAADVAVAWLLMQVAEVTFPAFDLGDRAIVLLLGLGVTYFAVDKFLLDPARDEERIAEAVEQARTEALEEQLGDKSIVVLPFTNLSSDSEQEYFADGMSEELLNLLARIPELRVISRNSAFAFKGKNPSLAEIA